MGTTGFVIFPRTFETDFICSAFIEPTNLCWNGRVVEEEGDVGRAEGILDGDDVHERLGHVQPAGLCLGQLVQVHHRLRRILLTGNDKEGYGSDVTNQGTLFVLEYA